MNNQERHTILIVDDDQGLLELLRDYLMREGFTPLTASSGKEMEEVIKQNTIDLMILDLMMPEEDGLTLLRRLRSSHTFPVIMLSAKGQDVDRIIGLEVGADDYIAKPFNPRELLARIRAVIRRQYNNTPEQHKLYHFGSYTLNKTTHTLSKDKQFIHITEGEFSLLELFCDNPNKLLNRDRLVETLMGYERMPTDRSIDIKVTRLRKKIEPDPGNPVYIRTVWGKGYQFTPDGDHT